MIAAGYASAKQVTQTHGRSFAFAAFALGAQRRRAAYAVYAFFRRLDDAFDAQTASDAVLSEARRVLDWLFSSSPAIPFGAWPQNELHALRDAINTHALARAPFDDMIAGMEMDLRGQTYPDQATLDLYCDRVAGTVGEIMAALLGAKERRALDAAVRLGRAMQLTNILRDVAEDRKRGRVYVPQSELTRFALSATDLHRADERWRLLSEAHIARARALYASAYEGIERIDTFSGRWLVQMMARIYGDILRAIEKRGHDVFSGRARVSLARKLMLMCSAFFAAFRVRQ